MAYRNTPVVRNHMLLLPGVPGTSPAPIHLDTPCWWHWLETATSFHYVPTQTIYAFTVRKEKRRNDWYWYAYLKYDSKLHNAYVGRSQDLSAHQLEQVTQTLRRKLLQWRQTLAPKGGMSR